MSPKQKNLSFALLLVAVVLFYTFSGNSIGIQLDFGEDALTVSASDRDWLLPYDQIESLSLSYLPDVGTMTEGIDKRTLQCGTWENESFGSYTLCVDPRIDACIVITNESGSVFVVNYENEDSTKQLHKMFAELLQSK